MSENDLRKQQVIGFYSDLELAPPSYPPDDRLKDAERKFRLAKIENEGNDPK